MIWVLTSKRASSRVAQPCLVFRDIKALVTHIAQRGPEPFEVTQVSRDTGQRSLQAASSFPGGDPGDWFPFKYTPFPPEMYLTQTGVPRGDFATFDFLHPQAFDNGRSIILNQNEIEAILVEDDLHRYQVDEAMSLLPDLTLFFNYLELKGARKALVWVRRLLSN